MKCYPFEEKRLAKWNPPYIVQPKYDGVRCRAVPTHSGYILLSSEENVIFSVPHLNETLNKIFNDQDAIYNPELDGELYFHGKSFEEIVSITSRTQNIHPEHECIQFHCFDVITNENQLVRLKTIVKLNHLDPCFVIAPFWICNNLDDITRAYDKLVNQGYEGIIVRNCDAPYERKRSTWVMKFKPKKEDEYEIVGFQEEIDKEGLPKGSLGALTCRSGDSNLFNVGTGFSADQRQILWEFRETLPGRIAKVKYQHITTGKKVPRFPVFVEIL
jgi:DNA ligase-1